MKYLPNHKGSTPNLREAFNQFFVPGKKEDCWEWQGYIRGSRYPVLQFKKQRYRVHRVSYMLHCGAIPKGMHVLHRCDNTSCVNPFHLFLGTHMDNMKDMRAKDRHARGSRHGNSKLTENCVRRIRAMSEDGSSLVEIAQMFNVSSACIRNVIQGRYWKHVT